MAPPDRIRIKVKSSQIRSIKISNVELSSKAHAICELSQLQESFDHISRIVEILKGDPTESAEKMLHEIIKHVLAHIVGGSNPSEGDSIYYWTSVIQAALPTCSGETGSSATSLYKSQLSEVFEVGKEARKCDCLLKVDGLEVRNFEAKREGCTQIEAAVLLRKNSKIVKSIFLQLKRFGVDCPPSLNIQGSTAQVPRLMPYEDIYVYSKCGPVIVLPDSEEDLYLFMEGGVFALWNLVAYLDSHAQDVLKKKKTI
ncbi:hypothetical protein BGX20_003746 [Mortierella sp. AD010]|nr:hypothetical protein BGX20_003746 [Mortierella sp. AD010]